MDYQNHRELVEEMEQVYEKHGYRFERISAVPVGDSVVWRVWTLRRKDDSRPSE